MYLSRAQVEVLRSLDGATAPVVFSGTRKRTVDSLRKLGLVSYRLSRKPSPTYYYPGGSVLQVVTSLTGKGSDFIYEGGLDKPRPVV